VLLDDADPQALIHQDESRSMQLSIYPGCAPVIPIDWLLEVVQSYNSDLQRIEKEKEKEKESG
jgi:hypothetical protein